MGDGRHDRCIFGGVCGDRHCEFRYGETKTRPCGEGAGAGGDDCAGGSGGDGGWADRRRPVCFSEG